MFSKQNCQRYQRLIDRQYDLGNYDLGNLVAERLVPCVLLFKCYIAGPAQSPFSYGLL